MVLKVLTSLVKNLSSFRTGIVKACWPRKLPMANPQAVLILLDAPDCCDPELYVIWSRFRQLRRFLAYRPEEVPRVYRLLDLAVVRFTYCFILLVSWGSLGIRMRKAGFVLGCSPSGCWLGLFNISKVLSVLLGGAGLCGYSYIA